jgi:hypothetical protein
MITLNFAPSIEIDTIRIPAQSIRNIYTYSCSSGNRPSAANAVCELVDAFRYICLNLNNLN